MYQSHCSIDCFYDGLLVCFCDLTFFYLIRNLFIVGIRYIHRYNAIVLKPLNLMLWMLRIVEV